MVKCVFDRCKDDIIKIITKADVLWDMKKHPRRFGKSLLCNTFKAYFQGQKELFEGLKIMNLEKQWKTTQLFSTSSRNSFSLRPVTVGSEVKEVKEVKVVKEEITIAFNYLNFK